MEPCWVALFVEEWVGDMVRSVNGSLPAAEKTRALPLPTTGRLGAEPLVKETILGRFLVGMLEKMNCVTESGKGPLCILAAS